MLCEPTTTGASRVMPQLTISSSRRRRAHLAVALAVTIGGAAAVAAPARATGPSIRPLAVSSLRGPGFQTRLGAGGEADVNVCSAAVAPGFMRCLARVRTDNQLSPNLGNNGGYDPAYLQSAYNAPSASRGSGRTIAIVDAYDSPTAEADLAYYRSQFGLSACTTANGCFKKVDQKGGRSYPAYDPGWALEIALDIDMASAICPNCKILLVEATDAYGTNLLAAEQRAVSMGASVISNSWGGDEFFGEGSYESVFNQPNIPITVSSGDDGYGVEWPAASPYVIAVGGTTLNQATNTGTRNATETVWSGAGSGCSAYDAKPAWQSDGCATRMVADVSAVADPNTGVRVRSRGQWYVVGGTSAAAPIVAGMYALAATPTGGAGAYLYSHSASLNDITSGSNGSCAPNTYRCTGVAGYDGPTGLGTPNDITAFGGPGAGGATAPLDTAWPTVTGSAVEGRTLNGARGAWTSTTPIAYAYQWQRCTGASCSNIAGATALTHVVGAADVGHALRLRVTATNATGSTVALSMATRSVAKGTPLNVVLPALTGTAHSGSTLTSGNGTWRGTATITYMYQWLRCNSAGSSCVPISGATHKTYTAVAADKNRRLRDRVYAKNSLGTVTALSAASAVVT